MSETRQFLRHATATIAYRGAKVPRGAPPDSRTTRPDLDAHAAGDPVAHRGSARGRRGALRGPTQWREAPLETWERQTARFHAALASIDAALAADASIEAPLDKWYQGPFADALTHVGQLCDAAAHVRCAHERRGLFLCRHPAGSRRSRADASPNPSTSSTEEDPVRSPGCARLLSIIAALPLLVMLAPPLRAQGEPPPKPIRRHRGLGLRRHQGQLRAADVDGERQVRMEAGQMAGHAGRRGGVGDGS